jgi:hypothetical protein
MQTNEISFVPNVGGLSQKIALTTASAQTTVFGTAENKSTNVAPTPYGGTYVNLLCDTAAFIRVGVNPVAVNTGVDQYVPAGQLFRVGPIPPGNKLAIIALTGTGNAYITPEN